MRAILRIFMVLLMLVVVAVGAIMIFVDSKTVRDHVVAAVREQTGRELTVGGETSLSLYPSLGVELGDVSLSNPPGMGGGAMLSMEHMTVRLKLLPLLSQRFEVERFVLVKPVFDLLVDRSGRQNWDFANPGQRTGLTRPLRLAQAATGTRSDAPIRLAQAAPAADTDLAFLDGVKLGDVRIINGTVRFFDERSGASQLAQNINVRLTLEDIRRPLTLAGDLVWRGEKLDFDGTVSAPRDVIGGGKSPLKVDLASRWIKLALNGQIKGGAAPSLAGEAAVSSSSVRGLAAWLGSPLPQGGGLGPLSVRGQLRAQAEAISFTKAKLSLDGMNGSGDVHVALGGQRPAIRATLTADKLDLNPYLQAGSGPKLPVYAPPPASSRQTTVVSKRRSDMSIRELIDDLDREDRDAASRAAPARRPSAPKSGGETGGLKAVDADLRLRVQQILFQKIKIGQSALDVHLKNGLLNANLTELNLYQGKGTGRVTVDGNRKVPALSAKLNLAGVSALPLMKDAADFDWVSGAANMSLSLVSAGTSEAEVVKALQGTGNVKFTDGAIEGINIPRMLRSLEKGQLSGWSRQETLKTDFSSLTGSFKVVRGIVQNNDLTLIGPLLRMTGAGQVDLPAKRLDYTVKPKLVASLEGQGGAAGMKGLEIPVRIKGPWNNPQFIPDLTAMLSDPDQAVETVKELGKQFKGIEKQFKGIEKKFKDGKITEDDVNQLLQGVLGGGNRQGDGDGAAAAGGGEADKDGEAIKPADLLNQFLKR